MVIRLLKLVISAIVWAVDQAWAVLPNRIGGRRGGRRIVLYYHAVSQNHRSAFARQMEHLLHLTTPVTATGPAGSASGRSEVVVTFDDGFMSVVEHALPELRRRGIPCVMFVPTGCLGAPPSWLSAQHGDAREIVISATMLREFRDDPLVEVGAHSVTHPDLRRLDDEGVRRELELSKADLERILGAPVTMFSFPHGAWDGRCVELARQAGYSRVFTIEPRPIHACAPEFVTGRVRIELDDWPIEFRLKVSGAYRWLAGVTRLKRGMRGRLGPSRVTSYPLQRA